MQKNMTFLGHMRNATVKSVINYTGFALLLLCHSPANADSPFRERVNRILQMKSTFSYRSFLVTFVFVHIKHELRVHKTTTTTSYICMWANL